MKYLFDYFWKPIRPFSKFCVNCLSMFYFEYSNNWVLINVNGARWWHCACLKCVSGLRRLEKSWTFWDAFMSLPGAQMLFRHKWKIWYTASFLLRYIGEYSCVVYKNGFFSSVGQVFWIEVFSYSSVTETFAIEFQNWFDHKCNDFGVFCWNVPRLFAV